MHTAYSTLLAFAALRFSTALPQPMADRPPPPPPPHYFIDSQQIIDGPPFNGGLSVSGGESRSLPVGISEQYAVSFTWEVGGDAGLNVKDVISLGLSASVSETTETAIASTASGNCPDGAWTCALQILPSVLDVKGHVVKTDVFGTSTTDPYEVTIPRTDVNNNAFAKVTICACKNRLSWADAGAPPPCPQDCA